MESIANIHRIFVGYLAAITILVEEEEEETFCKLSKISIFFIIAFVNAQFLGFWDPKHGS